MEPAPSAETLKPDVFPDDLSPARKNAQREFMLLTRRVRSHPLGMLHIGHDGMMRALDHMSVVVDAVPLEPSLIKAYLDQLDYDEELEAMYRGADGTKVPAEQWYHPPDGILPSPCPEEHVEEGRRLLEKMGKGVEITPGAKRGEEGRICPVIVKSDYKIEVHGEDGAAIAR